MELVARVLITIKDDYWQEDLENKKKEHYSLVSPEESLKYDLGKAIESALTPSRLSSSRNFDWDRVEFIEWEEQKGE